MNFLALGLAAAGGYAAYKLLFEKKAASMADVSRLAAQIAPGFEAWAATAAPRLAPGQRRQAAALWAHYQAAKKLGFPAVGMTVAGAVSAEALREANAWLGREGLAATAASVSGPFGARLPAVRFDALVA